MSKIDDHRLEVQCAVAHEALLYTDATWKASKTGKEHADKAERDLRHLMKADDKIARAKMRVSEGDARRSAAYALAKAEGRGVAAP